VIAGFPGWWSAIVGKPPSELFGSEASFRKDVSALCRSYVDEVRTGAGSFRSGESLKPTLESVVTARIELEDGLRDLDPPDRYYFARDALLGVLFPTTRRVQKYAENLSPTVRISKRSMSRLIRASPTHQQNRAITTAARQLEAPICSAVSAL
jgi:hypothetical protein